MASLNLPHPSAFRKSTISRTGVLTIHGFGIRVRVHSGHLEIEDGVGPERRKLRFARVTHGLQRLVLIGSDGFITLEALRWLTAQDVAFVMLERDGKVLCVTGPVRPSDARLRRAQALATQSDVALRIARELIDKKLEGQERVARDKLNASESADAIHRYRSELAESETLGSVRLIESKAASAYWGAWRTLKITFPRKDEPRLAEHWRVFGARISPLTHSPRLAVNPANAILNYLYALLESESRLASAALGLDPGIGVLHVDTPARDSLACDLMEPARPHVDEFLLDWIMRESLKREWFHEERDGNCRLMSSFASRLSETASTWTRVVAPFAEWVAQTLWNSARNPEWKHKALLPTRLTQRRRTEAKGIYDTCLRPTTPQPERICRGCGASLRRGTTHCGACARSESSRNMREAAKLGRIATHSARAEELRANTQRQHAAAIKAWAPSEHPKWLTEAVYLKQIQPVLRNCTVSSIATILGVSLPYATKIRQGRSRPHRRHWQALSRLVGIGESE